MNQRRRWVSCGKAAVLTAVGIALIGVAGAQTLTAEHEQLIRRYGGVLAPKCGNYLLPQLKYLGDSLVVQDGGKAVLTGRNVKAAPSYFGAIPPPEFETALTSEVAGGEALVFVFYRDASGLFATVEGGSKVISALPAALRGTRVRHCARTVTPRLAQRQLQPGEQRQGVRAIQRRSSTATRSPNSRPPGFSTTRRQERSTTRRSALS